MRDVTGCHMKWRVEMICLLTMVLAGKFFNKKQLQFYLL